MENLNILKKYTLTILAFFSIIDEAYTQKAELLKKYSWRAIGPANMGGRVTDIDGVPGDPSTFYVSGADGGIHKTIDGGVNLGNAQKLLQAGADVLVAGSAVFNTPNPTETIESFKNWKKQLLNNII